MVQGLSDLIGEAIRMLPVTRAPGVSYRTNEVKNHKNSAMHFVKGRIFLLVDCTMYVGVY